MSNSKALVLRDDTIFIHHPDRINEIEYYKSEIKRLNKSVEKYKNILNELSERKDLLEAYKKLFNLYCIGINRIITILRCAERIEKGHCTFQDKCKVRNELLKLLKLK